MTVLEIMERAGTRDTKLVVNWVKDAIHLIQSSTKENLTVDKQNIVKAADGDDNQYDLPANLIAIDSVSVLATEDDSKYKAIARKYWHDNKTK